MRNGRRRSYVCRADPPAATDAEDLSGVAYHFGLVSATYGVVECLEMRPGVHGSDTIWSDKIFLVVVRVGQTGGGSERTLPAPMLERGLHSFITPAPPTASALLSIVCWMKGVISFTFVSQAERT